MTRRWTAARLDGYLAALTPADGAPAALPPGGDERVDGPAAAVEATILGLRLDTGLRLADALPPPLGDQFGWALAAELVEVVGERGTERVRLTTRGRLLSNELFGRLV